MRFRRLWFNPLVWLFHRRLIARREEGCDSLVLSTGAPPAEYAEHLLALALTSKPGPRMRAALAISNPNRRSSGRAPGQLERRIRQLFDEHPCRPVTAWFGAGILTGAMTLGLLTAFLSPRFGSERAKTDREPWSRQEVVARWSADPFPAN